MNVPISILAFKSAHDGSIVSLRNGELIFSYEAEKDSFLRYSGIHPQLVVQALMGHSGIPDVIALSGWTKGNVDNVVSHIGAGYTGFGRRNIEVSSISLLGRPVKLFSSSHERSHLMCSYGMSPFEQGDPCYELVWEGTFGAFYEIDKSLKIRKLGTVLREPGERYSFLYSLATKNPREENSDANSGKLMALCGFSKRSAYSVEEAKTAKYILDLPGITVKTKSELSWSPFYNSGVESDELKQFAGKFSDNIFDLFYRFAKKKCNKHLPLLISGGCGLNCEWNSKWRNSGLFSDVFVPPVTNDTGSAIGTAIDAHYHFTGQAKISWNVYSGAPFVHNHAKSDILGFKISEFNVECLASLMAKGGIFAFVQGNCEIGPRALGNRSIIAAPFAEEISMRMNRIKKRENYRPIAPLCLEDDVSEHFEWEGPSPYMLYFQKVKSKELKAITHVDQTARVQTVTKKSNSRLFELMTAFKTLTGYGVLCNTSLNFNGCGFINNFQDLLQFAQTTDIDGFVVNDKLYLK